MKPIKKSKIAISRRIYLSVITPLSIFILGAMGYSYYMGNLMVATFTPLIDATMEVKLETTTAHLWFEEIISGDRHEDIDKVWKHLERADWYINVMLKGGKNQEGIFIPITNDSLIKEIKEVKIHIENFKDLTNQRYAMMETAIAGTDIDEQYDSVFRSFITQIDDVETKLQNIITTKLARFKGIQIGLVLLASALIIVLIIVFNLFEKRKKQDYISIKKLNADLKEDIIKHKQLEEALLENQHRYEKSQELGHVGNWEYNLQSELFWVSDESKRIYGFNLDDNNFDIERVENCILERERVHQALIDLIEHDKKYDLEFEIIPADKTPRKIIHSIAELERDASNNPLIVRGVILDVTKRKQSDTILDNLPIGYNLFDAEGKVIFVNNLARRYFGVAEDDPLIDYRFFDDPSISDDTKRKVKNGEVATENRYIDFQEIEGHKMYKTEKTIDDKLFIRLVYKSYGPPRNPSGIIVIIQNLTELKQSEEELRESEAKLKELNSSKDKFFSIIGHDLKSPFNSILGFSELLIEKSHEKDYEGIEKYAKTIEKSSKQAVDLLTNLMGWSLSQTGKMEFNPAKVDIVELIDEVVGLLKNAAQLKSITISTEFPDNAQVLGDKAMISTILRNLISNAIKFTHTDGTIVISAEQQQNEWMICVSDSGVGIHKEALDKLFRIEDAQSTKGTQNEKGTGLGLILCKEFVDKHAGRIWVESVEGKGSVFKFTLPLNKL